MKKIRNFALVTISLISAVNTFGSIYLHHKYITENAANNNTSLDGTEYQEHTDSTATSVLEGDHSPNHTTSTALTDISTPSTTKATDNTESLATTQQNPSSKKYEIKDIAKLTDTNMNSIQCFAVDLDDNVLYYLDNKAQRDLTGLVASRKYFIMKYDISSGTTEQLNEYGDELSPIALAYNPFDRNVYCFSASTKSIPMGINDVYPYVLCNLSNNSTITLKNTFSSFNHIFFDSSDYRSIYFTSATKFIINSGGTTSSATDWSIPILYQYDLSDDSVIEGGIDGAENGIYDANIPFLYNDNYYWLCVHRSYTYELFDVVETDRLFYPTSNKDFGTVLAKYKAQDQPYGYAGYNWRAANVCQNEVYLMDKDFSFFKLNVESVETELYLDGKEINQTGDKYLTEIHNFAITSDGSIIVYDEFDSKYKLITRTT